ncbi:MAG: VWA domain-containing protein [Pseudomonadota bacterium]|nr:VWA domain-containing protein [Pseudomonadota bacterium]
MLNLAYPWMLVLLPLPLLVALFLPPYRQSRPAAQVPFLPLLTRLTGRQPESGAAVARRSLFEIFIGILVWLALVLALARPQWLEAPLVKELPMRDMLLAVDLSGSMETEDFTDAQGMTVDRLSAVKQVLDDFLTRREDDRIGLIVFGSAAFLQAPFTDDLEVLRTLLDEVELRMAGPKTALGDAIGMAMTLFERSELEERVLIVLTDGNDTGSLVPPDKAAAIAQDNGVVVHAIGIGDPKSAGEEKLDEATLRKVAETTGGRYFYAADRQALEEVYAELDRLAPRKVETLSHRPQRDLFHWPLGAALVLTILFQLLQTVGARLRARRDLSPVPETGA